MIKSIDDSLYSIVCEWWSHHGFTVLPRGILPSEGYISFVGEKPIFAAWLYTATSGSLGLMVWLTANPESKKDERVEGFKILSNHISEVAEENKIKILITATNNNSLCDRFLDNGFKKADENVIHLFKEI